MHGNKDSTSSSAVASIAFAMESKKIFLRYHTKVLHASTEPSELWLAVMKHRSTNHNINNNLLQGQQTQVSSPSSALASPSSPSSAAAAVGAASPDGLPPAAGGEGGNHSSSDEEASAEARQMASESLPSPYDDVRLSYEGYRRVAFELIFRLPNGEESLEDDETTIAWRKEIYYSHPFLSPATFLAFERDASRGGTVAAVPLYAYIAKRLLLYRLRIDLELAASVPPPCIAKAIGARIRCPPSHSSPLSNSLAPEDMELFVSELLPNLRLVRDMPPWMIPYYLCHASRKFFFSCDPRGIGAIPIDVTVRSDVFSELLRMFESDPRDATVTFPIGAVVEAPKCRLDPACTDEEEIVEVVVESFENDGNELADLYKVIPRVAPPSSSSSSSSAAAASMTAIEIPRGCLYWCPATSESLSPDLLSYDNWFSLPFMHRVYTHFTQLDADADGVLTWDEFKYYHEGSYVELATRRVFDCFVSCSGNQQVMDYKGFLHFVVATEHTHTPSALHYLWTLLDLDGTKTYITLDVLRCFTKEIAEKLIRNGLMSSITGQSILSEVIDMINPAWHEWITMEDLKKCKQQATVLLILLNYKSFHAYDCREQHAAASTEEFVA